MAPGIFSDRAFFVLRHGDNRTADQQNGKGIQGKRILSRIHFEIRQHAIGNGFAPAAANIKRIASR